MAEFEEKLNAILGNREAMGQIMALAQSLTGGGGGDAPSADQEREDTSGGADWTPPETSTASMPDLSALLGQVDPSMIQMAMGLLREYQSGDDRNAALLAALRPFLKEDRQERLDRAIRIARMTRLIRVALGAIGGKGEEDRV